MITSADKYLCIFFLCQMNVYYVDIIKALTAVFGIKICIDISSI